MLVQYESQQDDVLFLDRQNTAEDYCEICGGKSPGGFPICLDCDRELGYGD